jgi:hypothetical protein
MLYRGANELRSLIDTYQSTRAAEFFSTVEALHFAEFLIARPLPIPYLDEVLRYEHRLLDCLVRGNPAIVTFMHEPTGLFDALSAAKRPHKVPTGTWSFRIAIEPGAEQPTAIAL